MILVEEPREFDCPTCGGVSMVERDKSDLLYCDNLDCNDWGVDKTYDQIVYGYE